MSGATDTESGYSADESAGIAVPIAIARGEGDEFIESEHAEYLNRTVPTVALAEPSGVRRSASLSPAW